MFRVSIQPLSPCFHYIFEQAIRAIIMATLPSLFEKFLSDIRPTEENKQDYKDGHETLRERLCEDDTVSEYYVGDFLQGSYRRWTAVKPVGDEKSDVDIILVTNLDKNDNSPAEAMENCEPFLEEHYGGQWERKHRAYQIDEESVELDLVLTAAPSEAMQDAIGPDGTIGSLSVDAALDMEETAELLQGLGFDPGTKSDEWKIDPLDIPDRELEIWEKTHPLYTTAWTIDKNARTNKHYVNVVKTIKWWRRTQVSEPERPKGYPLEHIVGWCCPNDIETVAEGVTLTFEDIAQRYATHAQNEETPFLGARGLPDNNVLARIDGQDFAAFHENVVETAELARQAHDEEDPSTSRDLWHSLLGDEFPPYGSDDDDSDGERQSAQFRSSSGSTSVSDQRFA